MADKDDLKLKLSQSKAILRKLLELTKAINDNQNASELYSFFEVILFEDLEIEKYVFFKKVEKEWITTL